MRYIIRRLLWVVVLLILVSFLTFIIFYTLPSTDPAELRAGRQPNPELVQQIRENLGLSDPWYQQYFHYMEDLVLHFDLGYSYQNTYPVKDQIFDRLPASISLAIGAAVIWLLLGISIGVISAVRSRIRAGSADDGAGPGRDLRAGLLARPRRPLPVLGGHRQVPSLHGCGQLRPVLAGPVALGRVPDHAVVRPRGRVRSLLRAAGARQHDRGDVRGLHSHGAREGAPRAARDLPPRAAKRDHAGRHRGRARHRDPARRHDPCRDRVQHPRRRQARVRLDRECATCR